jgi:hypothetical protein
MKTYKLLLGILIVLMSYHNSSLKAQTNLVPNPLFQDTVHCPTGLNQVYNAVGWSSFGNTPDYYNSCANTNPLIGVPYNLSGYQQPVSGNAYCGFYSYDYTADVHEIIGCALTAPLTIGQKYYVTFKVVNAGLSDTFDQGFNCCVNKIGARFSTIAYSSMHPAPINNFAQIYTDSIIKDTVNWYTIAGSFIADSSYQYIAIGNFFQDVNTDTIKFNTWACRAYYLVDGICVSTDSLYAATWTAVGEIKNDENNINVFPNPTDGVTHIKFTDYKPPEVSVYNELGGLVYPILIYAQNEIGINFSELNEGIYFLQFRFKEKTISKIIIIIK